MFRYPSGKRPHFVAVLLSLFALCSAPAKAAPADPALEAKRKSAADLVRINKNVEAIDLYGEIIVSDGATYKDFLALARVHDKLGHTGEAKFAYKKVVDLLATPKDFEERRAREEADKHIKLLGVAGAHLDDAVTAFLKKLDVLEKEAADSKDGDALDRIFRLRGAFIRAEKPPKLGYAELTINNGWVDCGLKLAPGDKVHVIARGTWRYGQGPETECTAAGSNKKLIDNRPIGLLLACVDGSGFYVVGEEAVFTVDFAGKLLLYSNPLKSIPGSGASGTIWILVRKE